MQNFNIVYFSLTCLFIQKVLTEYILCHSPIQDCFLPGSDKKYGWVAGLGIVRQYC